MGVNKVHIVQLLKKEKLIQVYTWWFKPGRKYGRKKKKQKKEEEAGLYCKLKSKFVELDFFFET